MNKVYFVAPLFALLVFAGLYSWSTHDREARAQARAAELKATQKAAQETKLAAERAARETAIAEQLERKKERLAREAVETAEREARQSAIDARDFAYREQERLAREIERIKRDVAAEQEAVNRLQIDKDAALAEQAYLKAFVPQARANAAALEAVLAKLAETARAQQDAANARKKS